MEVRWSRWERIALLAAGGMTAVLLTSGCTPNAPVTGYQGNGYGQDYDYGQYLPNGADNPPKKGEAATLSAINSTTVGIAVTDRASRTLYRFDNDTNNPPRSNCRGRCVNDWIPAKPTGREITTRGVSRRMVDKIKREDGSWQLTLAGWPLYSYVGDKQPGQVNGQGIGGTWWAIGPTGDKSTATNTPNGQLAGGTVQTRWGPLSPSDRMLIVAVRNANLWEQPAGQQAAERGNSAQVRKIGALIAGQHTQLDDLTRKVAGQLGVPLQTQPAKTQQQWLQQMNQANGPAFDEMFVNRLRTAHGGIFPVIGAVRGSTQNTVVRDFAVSCGKFVNNHMTYLESTGLVGADDLPAPPPLPPPPPPGK
jgi:predicted lipoprotein with Yx(FWY)xxD motif/predicted outer membrane protein